MKLAFHIALRYFLSKEKQKFINYIAIIAVLTVALGSAAMLVVMSAFNGLKSQIHGVHAVFDPEIKIEPILGKSFFITDSLKDAIESVPGVHIITEVIEDDAFLLYRKNQKLVRIKGVSENYTLQNNLKNHLRSGSMELTKHGIPQALIGVGVQYEMGISMANAMEAIKMWYPKKNKSIIQSNEESFNTIGVFPAGVFEIERSYDEQFIFLSIQKAEELTDNYGKRTSLEIKTNGKVAISQVIEELQGKLSPTFSVLSSEQQHDYIYKAIKIEKLMALLIISALLILASFTTFLTLSMMVLSKERDIACLFSLGASQAFITKVFLCVGMLIGVAGTLLGISIGSAVCLLQEHFGMISMGVDSALTDAYPVKLLGGDMVFVCCISLLISLLISLKPAYKAYRVNLASNV